MADRKIAPHAGGGTTGKAFNQGEGETRVGGNRPGIQGVLYLMSNLNNDPSGSSLGSVFAIDSVDSAGVVTTYYLWIKADGKLYISSTDPTSNTETATGTVVGSQS